MSAAPPSIFAVEDIAKVRYYTSAASLAAAVADGTISPGTKVRRYNLVEVDISARIQEAVTEAGAGDAYRPHPRGPMAMERTGALKPFRRAIADALVRILYGRQP